VIDVPVAVPLLEIDADTRALLIRCLPEQSLKVWLHLGAAEAVADREDRDRRAASVHVVPTVDGLPLGWAGWLRYLPEPRWAETTTFLTPPAWGTGLNVAAKGLQYQVARAANIHLVASVHEDNIQSRRAIARLWPSLKAERIWEEPKQRWASRVHLTLPPDPFVSWDPATVDSLAKRVGAVIERP